MSERSERIFPKTFGIKIEVNNKVTKEKQRKRKVRKSNVREAAVLNPSQFDGVLTPVHLTPLSTDVT